MSPNKDAKMITYCQANIDLKLLKKLNKKPLAYSLIVLDDSNKEVNIKAVKRNVYFKMRVISTYNKSQFSSLIDSLTISLNSLTLHKGCYVTGIL